MASIASKHGPRAAQLPLEAWHNPIGVLGEATLTTVDSPLKAQASPLAAANCIALPSHVQPSDEGPMPAGACPMNAATSSPYCTSLAASSCAF